MLSPLIFSTPFRIVAAPPMGRMVALTMMISAGSGMPILPSRNYGALLLIRFIRWHSQTWPQRLRLAY